MEQAAKQLAAHYHTAVLLKGGHLTEEATDILYDPETGLHAFPGKRMHTANTHGTGCTLSSALAAELAKGHSLPESVRLAKDYVAQCIGAGLVLGHGNGPICHDCIISPQ